MSGYGAGAYWLVYKITNGGVQPTWRPGQASSFLGLILQQAIYGVNQQFTTNTYGGSLRTNNAGGSLQVFTGSTTFDNPYSTNLPSLQSSSQTIAGNPLGFLLNTVDA